MKNIARVMSFAKGTPLWDEGLTWYSTAYNLCAHWRPNDVPRAAAVLSALSPRCPWSRNVELAEAHLRGHPIRVMGSHQKKLDAIGREDPPFPSLTGNKVRAFYESIVSRGTAPLTVCVDRHALSVYLGRSSIDEDTNRLKSREMYSLVEAAYILVALEFGVAPPQCQAITWVWWRENKQSQQRYLEQ